jgi:hypothetical protein
MTIDTARAARARYDALVTGPHLAGTLESLAAARSAGLLLHWERFDGCFLRPLFIDEGTYARARDAASIVGRAVLTATRRAMVDENFRRWLRLPVEREYAVALDMHLRPEPLVGRLDGFLDPSGAPRFIEYNAFPAGIPEMDRFTAVFDALPALRALREEFAVRRVAMLPLHAEASQVNLARLGFRRAPTVAVVEAAERCPAGTHTEPVRDFADAVAPRGIRVLLAPPTRFEYRDGRLLVDGEPVDFVTVSDFEVFTRMLADRHPALRAFGDGVVRFVDGLSTSFLALSKALFSALSDPEHLAMFDRATIAALRRFVPWTRVVAETHTTRDGARVDLVPHAASHRDELVLKPAAGHGGAGVVLGWQTSQERWEQALGDALREPHVVQARVDVPRERAPFADGASVREEEYPWDFCPFVWNGDWSEGALVRASRTQILNVGAGAAVDFPWFLVGDR